MNVYRKSLVIQFMLFIVFFIIGANVIINHYLKAAMPWIGYVVISMLVIFGVVGFIIYRKPDTRVSVVTQKEMMLIRYLLYGYFFVYILQMILSSIEGVDLTILNISIGSVLMLIALYGAFLQYRILKIK
ncbi:MAG: hypothetical protein ABH890_06905 [Bacillota bacterium]